MFDLKAFRQSLDVTQSEMASHMGMPLRSYQDVEAGKNPVRPIHETAAQMAALRIAVEKNDAGRLPIDLFNLVSKANILLEKALEERNEKPAS